MEKCLCVEPETFKCFNSQVTDIFCSCSGICGTCGNEV